MCEEQIRMPLAFEGLSYRNYGGDFLYALPGNGYPIFLYPLYGSKEITLYPYVVKKLSFRIWLLIKERYKFEFLSVKQAFVA